MQSEKETTSTTNILDPLLTPLHPPDHTDNWHHPLRHAWARLRAFCGHRRLFYMITSRRFSFRPSSHVLPTYEKSILSNGDLRSAKGAVITKRYTRVLFACLLWLAVLATFLRYGAPESWEPVPVEVPVEIEPIEEKEEVDDIPDLPPTYQEYIDNERNLPQHNLSLPSPEGRHAKFLWLRNRVNGMGLGNVLQEMILNTHLAYVTKRAFVFENFTWDGDEPDFWEVNKTLIPSHIPFSTMLRGPIIGDSYPVDDAVPRAVSKEYFNRVCPNATVISSEEVNTWQFNYIGADEVVTRWIRKLGTIDDPCVEIAVDSTQIFDIWIFGSERILPLWPSLIESPVLTQFTWSSLVETALENNMHLLRPPENTSVPSSFPHLPAGDQYSPIPGLLTLHLRRGDFEEHCHHFSKYSSTWNGFNLFPALPDQFVPPPRGSSDEPPPEVEDYYRKHCFPSIEQIVDKVMDVRATSVGKGLRRVYILTNGVGEWVAQLKEALGRAAKWENIVSSKDIELNREQKFIAPAVDMMIGQKGQVFVGNGFSSVTSNVVMLRMSRKYPPDSNRFW